MWTFPRTCWKHHPFLMKLETISDVSQLIQLVGTAQAKPQGFAISSSGITTTNTIISDHCRSGLTHHFLCFQVRNEERSQLQDRLLAGVCYLEMAHAMVQLSSFLLLNQPGKDTHTYKFVSLYPGTYPASDLENSFSKSRADGRHRTSEGRLRLQRWFPFLFKFSIWIASASPLPNSCSSLMSASPDNLVVHNVTH